MEQLIRFLPIIFRAINVAPQIRQAIQSGTPTVKAVEENAGNLLPLLGQIGKQMFPDIDDRLAPAAAATTMFDPVRVKWLQTALNLLGANPVLDVDGEYGPNTKAAVQQFSQGAGARQYAAGRRLSLSRRRASADHWPRQLSSHGTEVRRRF